MRQPFGYSSNFFFFNLMMRRRHPSLTLVNAQIKKKSFCVLSWLVYDTPLRVWYCPVLHRQQQHLLYDVAPFCRPHIGKHAAWLAAADVFPVAVCTFFVLRTDLCSITIRAEYLFGYSKGSGSLQGERKKETIKIYLVKITYL